MILGQAKVQEKVGHHRNSRQGRRTSKELNSSVGETARVSVILAAYDEASRLEKTLRFIQGVQMRGLPNGYGSGLQFETIVVNDGSSDGTEQVAKSLGAKVVSYPDNRGISYAFRSGIKQASGSYMLLLPSDFSDSFALERMVSELLSGFDIVQTSKRHRDSIVEGYGSLRWFVSDAWNILIRLFFRVDIGDTDYAHGLSARAARYLVNNCMLDRATGEAEMIIRAQRRGFTMVEIPCRVTHNGRKFIWPRQVVRAFVDLLYLRLSINSRNVR